MKGNKKNNSNFCWLFLRNSLGEFHVIVPELINLAEQENLKLHISFLNSKIEKQFFDNFLYNKLADRYFEVVERKNIISFAQRNKKRIKYLFREHSIIHRYSIARSLRIILPYTKLIMFPHAFAFYVSKTFSNLESLNIPSSNQYEDCVDAFISFTEADKGYFSKRFPAEIITVFTPRGLREEWLLKLQEFIPDKEIKAFQEKHPKRVLLTIRHPHRIYLSEKNYFELLREVVEVSRKKGFELFIKPHPRQNINDFMDYCEANDLHVWTKDTYTSALYFNYLITFWSSSSIDFAAFGIPSIEHFRFEKYHDQLVQKNGKLSSLYVNMGLSLPSSNKADLELAFQKVIENPRKIGKEQQKNLRVEYDSPVLNLKSIKFKEPQKFSFFAKMNHLGRLYNYFLIRPLFCKN